MKKSDPNTWVGVRFCTCASLRRSNLRTTRRVAGCSCDARPSARAGLGRRRSDRRRSRKSAAGSVDRSGFRRLVAEVSLGMVGGVAAREVSRFARNSREWQQLIEICRVVDTILVDHEAVYAPRLSNDRLLLGLKGSLDEIRARPSSPAWPRSAQRKGQPRRTARGGTRRLLRLGRRST